MGGGLPSTEWNQVRGPARKGQHESSINLPMPEIHTRGASSALEFLPIRTRRFLPPSDCIYALLEESLPQLKDGDVLVITSKVLAIHQGRCVEATPDVDRIALAAREADAFVRVGEEFILGIREHALLPNAGLDESNGRGFYILLPEDISALLGEIRRRLLERHGLRRLGVIATDSHTIPMRAGLLGVSIGFCGMEPLVDYRGKEDIFGRAMKFSQANVVDAIAAMSVLLMGEGSERQPLLILRGADFVEFTDGSGKGGFYVPEDEDLYGPLLRSIRSKVD